MADYIDFGAYVVRRLDGTTFTKEDKANSDYYTYMAWLALGNTPDAPPVPSIQELTLRAVAETRVQRQPIIEILDGLQASALTKGEATRAQVIETAKQGLRDITNLDLTTCTTYEEMRLKVKTAYFQLAAALPADLRLAFKEAIN